MCDTILNKLYTLIINHMESQTKVFVLVACPITDTLRYYFSGINMFSVIYINYHSNFILQLQIPLKVQYVLERNHSKEDICLVCG